MLTKGILQLITNVIERIDIVTLNLLSVSLITVTMLTTIKCMTRIIVAAVFIAARFCLHHCAIALQLGPIIANDNVSEYGMI